MSGNHYLIQIHIRSYEDDSFSLVKLKNIVKKEDNNIKLQENNARRRVGFKSKHCEAASK